MKRIFTIALVAAFVLGAFAGAQAETKVKMTGDARVYGVYFNQRNFTGGSTPSWTTTASGQSNASAWTKTSAKIDARKTAAPRLGAPSPR